MAKSRRRFVCESCGAVQSRWMGKCPECGEWNTLVETIVEDSPPAVSGRAPETVLTARPQPVTEIALTGDQRYPVPMEELNRVLGGGIVPGGVVLVGGDPGIGKSTLLLQLADQVARAYGPVLYASGEESLHQLKMRAERLGIRTPNLLMLAETRLEQIMGHVEQTRPRMTIVDSIQAVYADGVKSTTGSVTQVRESAAALLRQAKELNVPTFLVGHVTKTGAIAGPRVLEHIVDAVLYLEGERFHSFRLLRSVKNRYGSTNEVGVFEMRETGLVEVTNPSQVFLEERIGQATGSAVAVTMEGTRPILVEVQALVSQGNPERPYRTCNGIDYNRMVLLIAVLTKRVGLRLGNQDVFVNVVGGLRINEPAVDLAVAVAIASSFYNRPVMADLAMFGEVGLAGELRSVGQPERRLREAAKLGFGRVLVPRAAQGALLRGDGTEPLGARSLAEGVSMALTADQDGQ
ncbi:MAG: DNA repair protein RadA [Anaerolineae bacterium]|jgi:DNA repair protein RadA/Sms